MYVGRSEIRNVRIMGLYVVRVFFFFFRSGLKSVVGFVSGPAGKETVAIAASGSDSRKRYSDSRKRHSDSRKQ